MFESAENCALDNCVERNFPVGFQSDYCLSEMPLCKHAGREMTSMHYFAAWTDSGFFLGCSHEHETIADADSCIPCAGGYVVAVENGVMRSLTAEEESEFQRAPNARPIENPAVETTPVAPAGAAASDSGYAVMTRIRVGDGWTWTTWMRFATYTKAAAHAREGNRVVRFRSPKWAALREQTEAASPIAIKTPRESVPPRGEGETFLEYVLRFMSTYGFAQHPEPSSDVKHDSINAEMVELALSGLSESEIRELERMYAEDKHALIGALGNRFRTVPKPKSECD